MGDLSHTDAQGQARMVDVSGKDSTVREAAAAGRILMSPETIEAIRANTIKKGDVLPTARLAGIMAAKKTPDLIPLCHPLPLASAKVELVVNAEENAVEISAICRTVGQTGVEMEALTAVAASALCVYDMCKAIDRGMTIADIHLIRKTGGASGRWTAEGQ